MTGSPYPSVEAQAWRGLLGRAVHLWAARARLAELHAMSDRAAIRYALDSLHLEATAAACLNDPASAVEQTGERWRALLAQLLASAATGSEEHGLLSDVSELAQLADTADPFNTLFAALTVEASLAYGAAWVAPNLSMTVLPRHPRGRTIAEDPYGVSAACDCGTASVELQVFPDGLGPAAFAAIPRLLAHECVCHVAARQGNEVCNTSPFAEGFMDWAASFLLEGWIHKIDCDFAPAVMEHAGLVEQLLAPSGTREGAARRRGRLAARTVVAWWVSVAHEPAAVAMISVARLAIALNAVERPLYKKELLTAYLLDTPYPQHFADALSAALKNPALAADLLDAAE